MKKIQNRMKSSLHLDHNSEETIRKLVETEKLASVGILAAGVAHEISNPIAGIEVCAYRLLRFENYEEKQREYIDLIIEASRHIQTIVNSLLHFARQTDHEKATFELRETLQTALKLVKFRLEKNNIDVKIKQDKGDFKIKGIHVQFIQVFVNGLINAIEAIGENGTITINFTRDDNTAILTITDTGPGVEPAIKNNVFDPFFTTKVNKGIGLGLYVCYNIIKAHGGTIELESLPDKGAELKISLPQTGE